MSIILPSTADKNKLITLGEDIVSSWYAGTADEYYDSATRIWKWNAAEAGNDNDWDVRLGLSALCAVLYRFKKPRDVAQRQLWRRLAIETVDQWFTNQQDAATGGIWRTSLANIANDSGTCTYFGFQQVAIIAKCLNLRTRWATQIGRALDYTAGNGDLAYYTNGNIMFLKLVGFELGAWATDDADRRQDVEDLWEFTVDPTAWSLAHGNPNYWRGCGYIEETPGKGYFSETTTTGNSINHTGTNRLDWIYTNAQAHYAALGYLLFGDSRYLSYSQACIAKMRDRFNFTTCQFEYSGGSRNAGPGVRNINGEQLGIAGWIPGDATNAADASLAINHADNGMDTDFRRYLNTTHSTFVRGFGLSVGAAIIAAHGRTLA